MRTIGHGQRGARAGNDGGLERRAPSEPSVPVAGWRSERPLARTKGGSQALLDYRIVGARLFGGRTRASAASRLAHFRDDGAERGDAVREGGRGMTGDREQDPAGERHPLRDRTKRRDRGRHLRLVEGGHADRARKRLRYANERGARRWWCAAAGRRRGRFAGRRGRYGEVSEWSHVRFAGFVRQKVGAHHSFL